MRRATFADVSGWVLRAWAAVKPSTIVNGFKKAQIIKGEEVAVEEEPDRQQPTDLDCSTMFHSDSEEEDFEGFDI